MSIELGRTCKNYGMKLKQPVSFCEKNGRIPIKLYRYKRPFCHALIPKPRGEEMRNATTLREEEKTVTQRATARASCTNV